MYYRIIITFLFFSNLILASSKLENISLQLKWKHQFQFAGYYMAKEKGYYNDVNLNVKIKEWSKNIDVADDISNGISAYGIGSSSLVIDKARGKKIVLLFPLLQSSPEIILSKKSSNINDILDFKNKKIMIKKNSISEIIFNDIIKNKKNINLSDIKILDHTYELNDLIEGKTDLMTSYITDQPYKLKKQGIEPKIFKTQDYGFDFYSDLLFTSKKEVQLHEKRVNNFINASLKGWEYAFNHIDETIELILNKYNTQNISKDALKYEAKELKKLAFHKKNKLGNIKKSEIQRILDIYKLLGVLNKNIDVDEFVFNKNNMQLNLTFREKKYLQNNKIIKMCNNLNWQPIEFKENNKMQGISIDTLKLIENKLDIQFQSIATKDWTESQQFLKDKKCDILPSAISTKKREEYANFTKPYLKYDLAIITKNDKPLVRSLRDIVDQKMSRKAGSGLISVLKKKYPNINITETKNYLESLRMVENGKVDFTIATLPVASYYISKFALFNLHIAGYTNMKYELSIAIRDDKKILLDILNKTLNNITYKEKSNIENKWLSVNINDSRKDYLLIFKILLVVLLIVLLIAYRQYVLNKANKSLNKLVDKKTNELNILNKELFKHSNELKELNNNLEYKIKEEVDKNIKIEQHLFESKKLISMGEMIGNIAHQWRQPLSVISTTATSIIMQKELNVLSDEKLISHMNNINNSTQFLSKTIDDFRDLVKGDASETIFDLSKNIHKCLAIEENVLKHNNIELILNLDDTIEIFSYPNALIQSMINIINNSKDALIENNVNKKYIFINSYIDEKNVNISIKDNAGGISSNIIDNIFEPYFTTKHKNLGTGLGLSITYSMITQNMKGKIMVSNNSFDYSGQTFTGAEFNILLPNKEKKL